MANSNIVTLDKNNFGAVTSTRDKTVLVDFWAQWCGPCRAVTPVLERLAGEYPDSLIIGKVNIDEQQDLAVRNDIMSIPTIKIYKNGAVVDELIGARPYQDFKAAVDRHI